MTSATGIINKLLKDIPVPRVVKILQNFERPILGDVEAEFSTDCAARAFSTLCGRA